jgi:hypothetical protein
MSGSLQLALSKWSPEPAGSCGGRETGLPPEFAALELELVTYFSSTLRERSRIKKRIRNASIKIIGRIGLRRPWSAEELADLFSIAAEEFGSALWFFEFHSGFKRFDRIEHGPAIQALRQVLNESGISGTPPWFFEWGAEDRPSTTAFLIDGFTDSAGRGPLFESSGHEPAAGFGFVVDPDVHASALKNMRIPLHYKLHGWHPERWVRRYGQVRVSSLIRRIDAIRGLWPPRTKASALILAHSGRIEEAPLFRREVSAYGAEEN